MIIDDISIDYKWFLIKSVIIDDISIDYKWFRIKSVIIDDISIDYNWFRLKMTLHWLFCSFLIKFNRFLAIKVPVIKNNRSIFDYPMGKFLHGEVIKSIKCTLSKIRDDTRNCWFLQERENRVRAIQQGKRNILFCIPTAQIEKYDKTVVAWILFWGSVKVLKTISLFPNSSM